MRQILPNQGDPVERILSRLAETTGHAPKRSGNGWSARCPAHSDRNPSLSVSRGADGRALLDCKAGCTPEAVLRALDLEMKDLFGSKGGGDGIVACYDYRSEDGALLFQVVRFAPKTFRQRRPDGKRGWKWGLGSARRVLYRLPELTKAPVGETVFIAEGEKDADNLATLGLPATTCPMGAEKWRPEYGESLRGRPVVILPDNDDAGRRHVAQVAAALRGIAASVKVVALPDLPEKGDASDWLAAGGTKEALLKLAAETGEWGEETPKTSIEEALRASGLCDLSESDPDGIERGLRKLAEAAAPMDRLSREVLRDAAVKQLTAIGFARAAKCVDAALKEIEVPAAASGERSINLNDPAPWEEPVATAELLAELMDTFRRYVVFCPDRAEESTLATALWVLHTHVHEAADVSPRLAVTSPQKRCGKSTLLQLLRLTCRRALLASNTSTAAIYRAIEKYGPTLLLDEADTFLDAKHELHGVLNSGHTPSTAFVLRTVGDDHEPQQFSTWAPIAIAKIGQLKPDTLADRSLHIQLHRRKFGEQVQPLRMRKAEEEFLPLLRRCVRWASDHLAEIRGSEPAFPAGLTDRAQDNWHPLLQIADLAGDEWGKRAREAAVKLCGIVAADNEDGIGVELLKDIREIFEDGHETALWGDEIVARLGEREERPWPEWKNGRPMTPTQLARLLKPFGIRPKQIRKAVQVKRGYERVAFAEAFERYLADDPPVGGGEGAAEVLQPLQANENKDLVPKPEPLQAGGCSTSQMDENPSDSSSVARVALRKGGQAAKVVKHTDSGRFPRCPNPECGFMGAPMCDSQGRWCFKCDTRIDSVVGGAS